MILILLVVVAVIAVVLLEVNVFADEGLACYGYQLPDGNPLHSSSASTVVCSADCSWTGYCYNYTYDPDGTVPKTCTTGDQETGMQCIHDSTDVTKSGQEGDPTCFYQSGSTNQCQLAGQCLNWRSITNTTIPVPQDYTDSSNCRTPPGS